MLSHLSLSDSESPQVSRTPLSILADLNQEHQLQLAYPSLSCSTVFFNSNAIIWMVSTRPLISKSSSPYINPLVTVPKAPITIGITVTFMFHSFFSSLARSRYLSPFSLSFSFIQYSTETPKFTIRQILFFWLSQGLVVWPRLDDPFVYQNPKEFCASRFLGCAYTICS